QADAWRLIEIIHSKEWAAQSEETYYYRFSTRKDHAINLSDIDYHKEALYLLRAPNFLFRHGFDHFGMKTYKQDNFISYGSSYLKNVFDGKMNISEALEAWEADWNVSNPYNQAEIDERLELGLGR